MPHPKVTPIKQRLLVAATLSLILITSSQAEPSPALAHQVEIENDVGATLHIEPNDTPRAGEEILAWFALARKGGESIPLEACDCTMAVYQQTAGQSSAAGSAILEPALEAVKAESYTGIPGATFTFPAVGAYSLVISGSPKQEDDFTPFELAFDVTVAAGESAVPEVPTLPENENNQLPAPIPENIETGPEEDTARSASYIPGIALGIGGVILLGLGAVFLRRSR